MTEFKLHANDGDDEIVRELRTVYAGPVDEAYWNELEAKVMARISELDLGWWVELDRWIRPALVAAAILVVAAGVAMFRAHQAETAIAYENILTPAPQPVGAAVRPMLQDSRDATLRYILAR